MFVVIRADSQIYISGQEGIQSVYQFGQWHGQMNFSRLPSKANNIFQTSLSYSPWKNIGLLINYQTNGNSLNYFSSGFGYYFGKLIKFDLPKFRSGKPSIFLGNYFDFYVGSGLGVAKNQEFAIRSSFNSNQKYYNISLNTKRHYIQAGWHKMAKYLSMTLILRKVWLDADKIVTTGLDSEGIKLVEGSFDQKKYLSFLETNIVFNFGGYYKPFVFGYVIKLNDYAYFDGKNAIQLYYFFGLNQEIFNYFRKTKTQIIEVD